MDVIGCTEIDRKLLRQTQHQYLAVSAWIMCMYHEPWNVDQLMMKCDSVPVKVGGWEQIYPMGMSKMQDRVEIKAAKR